MREYTGAELINIAAKCQQKARESIQVWFVLLWDMRCDGIFLVGQETEKTSNITTYPAVWHHLHGPGARRGRGGSGYSAHYGLYYSSIQGGLA